MLDHRNQRSHYARLLPVVDAPHPFEVVISGAAGGDSQRMFAVTGVDRITGEAATNEFHLVERSHDAYLDLFEALARRFGTRIPRNRTRLGTPTFTAPYRALLTTNLAPEVRYGYGDPAIIRVGGEGDDAICYYLLATSNDAPDAFPIARSRDLQQWSHIGFVFPRGQKPRWAADGEGVSDFWAPEMHHVGGEFRVYFAARERDSHELGIGLASSRRPEGPFVPADAPLLRGNVIDPHVLLAEDGSAFLFWKEDANGVWPGRLNHLLHDYGRLIAELFTDDEDRRTASLLAALWPWVRTLEPMERFFVQQTLVEAVIARFTACQHTLAGVLAHEDEVVRLAISDVLKSMRTPIHAQRLAPDGRRLIGERTTVLQNDRDWEAHLIEGVWVARHDARFYLFYAGNDFSTMDYGIGVAIADAPLGPYRKMEEPLLRSTAEWWGPGHPSVAEAPDGKSCIFLHAFFPGRTGYNAFRALLMAPLTFEPDRVLLR